MLARNPIVILGWITLVGACTSASSDNPPVPPDQVCAIFERALAPSPDQFGSSATYFEYDGDHRTRLDIDREIDGVVESFEIYTYTGDLRSTREVWSTADGWFGSLAFTEDTMLLHEAYAYDAEGQLSETLSDSSPIPPDGVSDSRTLVTHEDGKIVKRQVYASSGQLVSETSYSYTYLDGRMSTQTVRSWMESNGARVEYLLTESYSYDADDRVERVVRSTTAGGMVVSECHILLGYNSDGTRASDDECGTLRVFLNGGQCEDAAQQRQALARLGFTLSEASAGTSRPVVMSIEGGAVFRPQR